MIQQTNGSEELQVKNSPIKKNSKQFTQIVHPRGGEALLPHRKYRLLTATSFQRAQYGKQGRGPEEHYMGEPGKHYLSRVTKVNVDKSRWQSAQHLTSLIFFPKPITPVKHKKNIRQVPISFQNSNLKSKIQISNFSRPSKTGKVWEAVTGKRTQGRQDY